MHLGILTQYYPPEIGAPQARLSELAKHFIEAGHEVTILTAMPNYPIGKIYEGYGGLLKNETEDQVQIIRTFIYPTQDARMLKRLVNYFSFVFSSIILGTFYLPRLDYLLVESPPLFLGLSSLWLSRLKRAKLIFNVSDLWPQSAVDLGVISEGGLAYRVSSILEKICYKYSWLVTGQSASILKNIKDRFSNIDTFHLSNGADTSVFKPDKISTGARKKLTQVDGKCIVFYAGLHGIAQGLDQVIDSAKLLQDDNEIEFVLVGDGPEKENLIQKAKSYELSNLKFFDSHPKAEIPPLIASADIVIIPLKKYILGAVPSKIYEAMASGKPIVLVASGEAADIIENNGAGIVVEPGDIEGITKAIQELACNPKLREEYGVNGRKAATNYFDRALIAKHFIDYLEENL